MEGFDAFMTNQTSGVDQTGLNVLRFKPGIAPQKNVRRVAAGKHSKNVFDPSVKGHTDQFLYRFKKPK